MVMGQSSFQQAAIRRRGHHFPERLILPEAAVDLSSTNKASRMLLRLGHDSKLQAIMMILGFFFLEGHPE